MIGEIELEFLLLTFIFFCILYRLLIWIKSYLSRETIADFYIENKFFKADEYFVNEKFSFNKFLICKSIFIKYKYSFYCGIWKGRDVCVFEKYTSSFGLKGQWYRDFVVIIKVHDSFPEFFVLPEDEWIFLRRARLSYKKSKEFPFGCLRLFSEGEWIFNGLIKDQLIGRAGVFIEAKGSCICFYTRFDTVDGYHSMSGKLDDAVDFCSHIENSISRLRGVK